MNRLRSLAIILMLSLFGLMTAANLFSKSAGCLEESIAQIHSCTSEEAGSSLVDHKLDASESDCSDPCHYGSCHFGHASIVIRDFVFELASVDARIGLTAPIYFESLILEGPTQPPRLS